MGLAARGQGGGTNEEASNKLATCLQLASNHGGTMALLWRYYGGRGVLV
jgi:hypothetical protein